MYASHRDACILSKYAADLTKRLDALYESDGLSENVVAYRRLGLANFDFSAEAQKFVRSQSSCVALCFDITGFFDNLDHSILKSRLKSILDVSHLPADWYAIFRHVTKFSSISRASLSANQEFKKRIAQDTKAPIATISEVLAAGIDIETNPKKIGIPQGTPISAVLSNLYMVEIDRILADVCRVAGAFYRRYSDDILIICPLSKETKVAETLKHAVATHRLEIKDEKTERAEFAAGCDRVFQYLGFNVSKRMATVRPSSLARQWRKAKYAIRRTKRDGERAIAEGRASKIFTKRLRRRFQPVGAKNFSRYVRRAAEKFQSKEMRQQVLKWERMVDKAIRESE